MPFAITWPKIRIDCMQSKYSCLFLLCRWKQEKLETSFFCIHEIYNFLIHWKSLQSLMKEHRQKWYTDKDISDYGWSKGNVFLCNSLPQCLRGSWLKSWCSSTSPSTTQTMASIAPLQALRPSCSWRECINQKGNSRSRGWIMTGQGGNWDGGG